MALIEISDENAAALKVQAATLGLSLEAWIQNLASRTSPIPWSV